MNWLHQSTQYVVTTPVYSLWITTPVYSIWINYTSRLTEFATPVYWMNLRHQSTPWIYYTSLLNEYQWLPKLAKTLARSLSGQRKIGFALNVNGFEIKAVASRHRRKNLFKDCACQKCGMAIVICLNSLKPLHKTGWP